MNRILKNIFNENRDYHDDMDIIFDALVDAVIIYNTKCIITKVNKAALDSLQFNPVGLHNIEFVGRTASGPTSGKPETFNGIILRALKGEIIKDAAYTFINKWGDKRFYTCSVAPIRDQNSIAGVILVWHDITESKKKEQQLDIANKKLENLVNEKNEKQKLSDRQMRNDKEEIDIKDSQIMVSNKLLEIIFSNTHFLIAYLDRDFTFIQVNDAYARAFSQKPDFFKGKNHFELFPHEENRTIFKNVIKTGESYITYARPFFHSGKPEPGITYWDWSLQPIKNNNEVDGIILVLINVTRRKKAEEDLLNAKRLSDIGVLAATVAHELRNPLGVIQASIYNIKRKSRNKELDKHIENINAKVEESEQIINNLLNYSKFQIPKRIEIPIYNFLNELLADIRNKYIKDAVTLKRNFEELKDTIVCMDSVQIREVLNNIINNAYQSLPPEDGCIEMLGSVSNNIQLHLHIKDNGCGIEKEDLEKVFDPFYTSKSRGTGLGLTICKELIKLHNGNIEIQSQTGQGTSVKISLPLMVTE